MPTEPVAVPGTRRLLWMIIALVLVLIAGGAVTATMLSSANISPPTASLTASDPAASGS